MELTGEGPAPARAASLLWARSFSEGRTSMIMDAASVLKTSRAYPCNARTVLSMRETGQQAPPGNRLPART